ncbi:MAG: hypothetical protein ACI36W_02265 [Coriobacteriales bacterium]
MSIVRRMLCSAAALAVLAAAVLWPAAALAEEPLLDIGTLSNRYEAIEEGEPEVDDTDNVVVTTRVGVLTAANRALDEATVSFTGEVVGDIMAGGSGHKWLNVLGADGSCIGVWVDDDMAARISNVGSYSTTGTTIQVRGIYSLDCADHQGELDVHALTIRVLDPGGPVTHYADDQDITTGLQLCAVAFILLAVFGILRWREDRRAAEEER